MNESQKSETQRTSTCIDSERNRSPKLTQTIFCTSNSGSNSPILPKHAFHSAWKCDRSFIKSRFPGKSYQLPLVVRWFFRMVYRAVARISFLCSKITLSPKCDKSVTKVWQSVTTSNNSFRISRWYLGTLRPANAFKIGEHFYVSNIFKACLMDLKVYCFVI